MKRVAISRTDFRYIAVLTVLATILAFAGLGSRSAPRSSWTPGLEGETAVADGGAVAVFDRVSCWVGLGAGGVAIDLSADRAAWTRVGIIEQPDPFGYVEWRVLSAAGAARYLRLVALRPGLEIGEVGAFGDDGGRIPLSALEGPREPFDEQAVVVRTPTARTGMYFDETYFARGAWEGLRGLPATETSHPPLGRRILSVGIRLWGMNPFGWRFMAAVAGALSVPALYLLARRLAGRPSWAFLAGLLFCVDFLRVAQSRMATVDVFVLLFSLLASWCVLERSRSRRPWPWLLGAGLVAGVGLAVKWSAAFPTLGVAVLAAAAEARGIRDAPPTDRARAVAAAVGRTFTCLVLVPLAVYAAAWLPDALAQGWTPGDLVARHATMYRYHASIGETRWYASAWWQWPLDVRPIWLYQGTVDVPPGRIASVVTMGNPATWWPGLAAIPVLAALAVFRRDRVAAAILLGLASAWLPWALSARKLTFIYHFLPASPFLALGLAHTLARLVERVPRAWPVPVVVAAAAVAVFAVFLPLLTGIPVPLGYAEALRWLPTWVFHG